MNLEVKCHSVARNGTTGSATTAASFPHELRDETAGEAQHGPARTVRSMASEGGGRSSTSAVWLTVAFILLVALSIRFHFEKCSVKCITKYFTTSIRK